MTAWKAAGPILVRIDDEETVRWVNPAQIEVVRGFLNFTNVRFVSGREESFAMPMTSFFARLAEATQAKYGD